MAGVPPFIGFFSKIFVMALVLNSYYFLFYTLFIVLLFLGLYFYMQNIRFIHSTNLKNSSTHSIGNERVNVISYYYVITLLVVIVFGLVYIDDFILFFT
jgi:NADH:ubiquinone oxidoreductase subunit 2 (subunit N)